jgi:hypothetical protein
MQVALNYWSPNGGTYDRIYVNGVPGIEPGSKVYLERRRGAITAKLVGDWGGFDENRVLDLVRGVVPGIPPGGELDWAALVAFAKTRTKPGAPAGTRASSRLAMPPDQTADAAPGQRERLAAGRQPTSPNSMST